MNELINIYDSMLYYPVICNKSEYIKNKNI